MNSNSKLIAECDKLQLEWLKLTRGERCQICGCQGRNKVHTWGKVLTTFHILPKSKYPRLRYYGQNVLLTCWFPCHDNWHNDLGFEDVKRQVIRQKIKKLLGEDIELNLKAQDKIQPMLKPFIIEMNIEWFKTEINRLKKRKGEL